MEEKTTNKIHNYYQVNTSNTIKEADDDKYNVGDVDICNACSTTDCTGLMYRPPLNEDEIESYHQIYTFGPPEVNSLDGRDDK